MVTTVAPHCGLMGQSRSLTCGLLDVRVSNGREGQHVLLDAVYPVNFY